MMRSVSAIIFGAMVIGQTAMVASDWSKAVVAAAEVFYLIDLVPPIDAESPHGRVLEAVSGEITFTDVVFAYPQRPDITVLKGLSFTVPPGKTLALVGPSGCGKSTTIQLLERFYDINRGMIAIDGMDVRDINVASLRAHMGLVSQEPVLFATTIRGNILYGKVRTRAHLGCTFSFGASDRRKPSRAGRHGTAKQTRKRRCIMSYARVPDERA